MPYKNIDVPAIVRNIGRFLSIPALLLLVSCASNSRLTITPQFDEVSAMGTSEESDYVVSVELVDEKVSNFVDELPAVWVKVENQTNDPVYFGPDSVRVVSGGESVRAYNAVDLALRIQEQIQKESEEYSGQQAEVFLQSGASQADPSSAMASITAAKRANRGAAERESRERTLEEIDKLVKSTQIPQGEWVDGLVKLYFEDLVPESQLTVTVSVGEEEYDFVFDVE